MALQRPSTISSLSRPARPQRADASATHCARIAARRRIAPGRPTRPRSRIAIPHSPPETLLRNRLPASPRPRCFPPAVLNSRLSTLTSHGRRSRPPRVHGVSSRNLFRGHAWGSLQPPPSSGGLSRSAGGGRSGAAVPTPRLFGCARIDGQGRLRYHSGGGRVASADDRMRRRYDDWARKFLACHKVVFLPADAPAPYRYCEEPKLQGAGGRR